MQKNKVIKYIFSTMLLFLVTSCGMKNDLQNETTDETTNGNIEFMADNDISNNESTSDTEKTIASQIDAFEEINKATFSDAKIQVLDMIFPIDGSITLGEAIEILEKSSYNLEFDITDEGIIHDVETYPVKVNGIPCFGLKARRISEEKDDISVYDTMFDMVVFYDVAESPIAKYMPGGFKPNETKITELENAIIEQKLTDDNSNPYASYLYYSVDDYYYIKVPAANVGIDGKRAIIIYDVAVDSLSGIIKDFTIRDTNTGIPRQEENNTLIKEYLTSIGYGDNLEDSNLSTIDSSDASEIWGEIEVKEYDDGAGIHFYLPASLYSVDIKKSVDPGISIIASIGGEEPAFLLGTTLLSSETLENSDFGETSHYEIAIVDDIHYFLEFPVTGLCDTEEAEEFLAKYKEQIIQTAWVKKDDM